VRLDDQSLHQHIISVLALLQHRRVEDLDHPRSDQPFDRPIQAFGEVCIDTAAAARFSAPPLLIIDPPVTWARECDLPLRKPAGARFYINMAGIAGIGLRSGAKEPGVT
jgi:hypothetical protein